MKFFILTVVVFSVCATQMSLASDQKSTKTSNVDCTKVEQTAELKQSGAESKAKSGDQTKASTVQSAQ